MLLNNRVINSGIIRTKDNCTGCNKCLAACPSFSANIAITDNGKNKVFIDQERCVICGKCMSFCTHDAREYIDDCEAFFDDLEAGDKNISLLIAPSFTINYPLTYKKILAALKAKGINRIYSVSTGADITVWGYIKYLKEHKGERGLISQPCPTIVNYIEKYCPDLIDKIIPVQSPLMCLAVYLRKYLGVTDSFAFISPCIAKKQEIHRGANEGLVDYNVTFTNLMKKLDISDDENNEELINDAVTDFELEYGMGAVFPEHGGLRDNIEFYLGLYSENYVDQKAGENYAYSFLDAFSLEHGENDECQAMLNDLLNCAKGCIYGTGTENGTKDSSIISYYTHKNRVEKLTPSENGTLRQLSGAEELQKLNERYSNLKLEDFLTTYRNRSYKEREISSDEITEIFHTMYKFNDDDCHIDCNSCGLRSCKDMAKAIALGYNHKENCIDYSKKKIELEHQEASKHKKKYDILQDTSTDDTKKNIDQLTGLKNRYAVELAIEKALNSAKSGSYKCCLLCIDIDDFISFNNTYTFQFGDNILIAFSEFLKETFDDSCVFRAGGDEFYILLHHTDEKTLNDALEKVFDRTKHSWKISGSSIYITVSIGVTEFPKADNSVNNIINNVDYAIRNAKKNGKNCYFVFETAETRDMNKRMDLIRQLKGAVLNDFRNFDVHYQPWVSNTGEIVGAEALCRWSDNYGNRVSPVDFIPVAESIGLIIQIGEFVLEQAATHCKAINEKHPNFQMSINVSVKQFNLPDIYERFMVILDRVGVQKKNIVLEITESLGIEDLDKQRKIFNQFKSSDIQIALDDFGTGYSSLSYINELPLDIVKVDKSFLANINKPSNMLNSISNLLHDTGCKVLSEGIESEEQLGYCLGANVDKIQGFYYYKPMPATELLLLLNVEEKN